MKPDSSDNDGKDIQRQALKSEELSDEDLAAIAAAEVPPEYAYLDEELRSEPGTCQKLSATPGDERAREGGQMRGKIRIAEDFDAPDSQIMKLFVEGDEP